MLTCICELVIGAVRRRENFINSWEEISKLNKLKNTITMKNLVKSITLMMTFLLFTSLIAFCQEQAPKEDKIVMKRFLVERDFPDGLNIPINSEGSELCLNVISKNLEDNVTWVHSYVTKDKKKTFCIYDAPSKEAIKKSGKKNKIPVGKISEVSVLDPYFYK